MNKLPATFELLPSTIGRRRVAVGVVLLIIPTLYFLLAPALTVLDAAEAILWANIVPGVVLAVLGMALA